MGKGNPNGKSWILQKRGIGKEGECDETEKKQNKIYCDRVIPFQKLSLAVYMYICLPAYYFSTDTYNIIYPFIVARQCTDSVLYGVYILQIVCILLFMRSAILNYI